MPQVAEEMRHKKLVSGFRADRLRLVSCGLDGRVQVRSLEPFRPPEMLPNELCRSAGQGSWPP